MKVLIAEDDTFSARILEAKLKKWGYDVQSVEDGKKALESIAERRPDIAILDWMLPEIDGIELCKLCREVADKPYVYIILLTIKSDREDISVGLEAGADDYVIKPFDQKELRSRLKVGERIIRLERELALKIKELETAMSQVKQLKGFLPICANCKKIRDDKGYWQAVETFVHEHTAAVFSHSICPDCVNTLYPDFVNNQSPEKNDDKPE